MNQPSPLERQIARAQAAISKWPESKHRMMQLQGTNDYSTRKAETSSSEETAAGKSLRSAVLKPAVAEI